MGVKRLTEEIKLEVLLEFDMGTPIGQCRAVPVSLGKNPKAVLAVYCADFDVDPYVEMFFFPKDTLKMILFDQNGKILWKRDLGRAVVPGMWFCPVFAFDLDGDQVDEIWFVNNTDPAHPLGINNYVLERIDPLTGKTSGQWKWPNYGGVQDLSYTFRNFILGGYVKEEPVLVTAQGTYGSMFLQGFKPDMSPRWEHTIDKDAPGARGSHMCPVADINDDGIDELMWGERCIELNTGTELFCGDRDTYRGHSDVIQPLWNGASRHWSLFTCRESEMDISPRVIIYDNNGDRIWGDINYGHMDMGWVARLGDNREHIAAAIRIANKTCGPDGRFHQGMEEFTYIANTGQTYRLPFTTYKTIPVDINGDGFHELVMGAPGGNGEVIDRKGSKIGNIGGAAALASKFFDYPGEQILSYSEAGILRVWVDRNAKDCPAAIERYENRFYKTNQKLTASGSNLNVLAGL